MMSEKQEGRKRLLTKPAAHRSLQQLPSESCWKAAGQLTSLLMAYLERLAKEKVCRRRKKDRKSVV